MNIEIYNFLPIYPEFDNDIVEILGEEYLEKGDANYNIYRKKEFYDYRLDKEERKPEQAGQLMKHQIIISKFLSSHTTYRGLLLMHEPGTGKTCSSIGAIERIRNETSEYKGALILMKGDTLINNYIQELVFTCTCYNYDSKKTCVKGKYIPEDYYNTDEKLTEDQKKRRIKKKISEFYEFETFEKFSRMIKKTTDPRDLIEKYSNYIIVIDEAHNLRTTDSQSQYESIYAFLNILKSCKIILLTGTPMVDQPEEIASIMNLILPPSQQFQLETFEDDFLEDGKIRKDKIDDLKNHLHGHISYLRSMKSNIKKEYIGDLRLRYFRLYAVNMSDFQSENYKKAYILDTENKERTGVYNESIQASLFIFPNGTYGTAGFSEFVEQKRVRSLKKDKSRTIYSLKSKLTDQIVKGTSTIRERLDRLRRFSVKYADCIEKLLENNNQTHFVYIKLVAGSGAILFGKLLELFGFNESKGGISSQSSYSYSIITSTSATDTETSRIIKKFNEPSNMSGKNIKVIIGSKKISEGITLKNVQNIHILTPSWNFSETDQAIARGYRLFSHSDLERSGMDVNVKIYLYCSLPMIGNQPDIEDSIDYQMYQTCEDKDIAIKSIENVIREASFDCSLNRERNMVSSQFDNTRECNYGTCEYTCDGFEDKSYQLSIAEIDQSTYNLFYDDKETTEFIKFVKNIFLTRTHMTLDELKKLSSVNMFTIMKSLDMMMNNNVIIPDAFGYNGFLRYDNDMIYLTYNLKNNTNFFDNYYVSNFCLQEYADLEDRLQSLYQENLPTLFQKMKEEEILSEKIKILQNFPIDMQELFLEQSILSRNMGAENTPMREFFISQFTPFIITLENETIVSTLLYQNKKENPFRCLPKGKDEWEDCISESQDIFQKLTKKQEELEENPYGYYGIFETSTGKFYIRDISDETKKKGKVGLTGKQKQTTVFTGRNCMSWDHKELIKVIHSIKLDSPPIFPEDVSDAQMKKVMTQQSFEKTLGDDLDKLYEEEQYKEIKNAFSVEDYQQMSRPDKLRILYWGRLSSGLTKKIICKTIQEWFKNVIKKYDEIIKK